PRCAPARRRGARASAQSGASRGIPGAPRACRACSYVLDDDHRDVALRARLIAIVVRPDRRHQLPETRLLVWPRRSGAAVEAVRPDLDLHVRLLHEVEVPLRMLVGAANRGDEKVPVAIPTIDQRGAARHAGGAPDGREQQRRDAAPDVAVGAVGLEITPCVVGNPIGRANCWLDFVGHGSPPYRAITASGIITSTVNVFRSA